VVIEVAAAPPTDEQTYRDLAPELIRFATALVGPSDAADVMASAFAKALTGRSWPAVLNRRAYLYRAVHNEARSHGKRSARRRDREAGMPTERTWELPGIRPDVRAAVVQLSIRQRAVIVLTYWADLDPAAIAEWLGISEGSVRRHLARARAHLREVLDAD
jgi:RNA polymerase sigma-70 factor (ECF subfamily)